jgi:hypothetical protein
MVEKVHSKTISSTQSGKYFSLIAACTPDISHVEQVTMRYVDVTNENCNEMCERFLRFTPIDVSSGKGLTDLVLKFLERNKLGFKHCRGQGYDNAGNRKGRSSGVQKRILDQNPLSFCDVRVPQSESCATWCGKIICQISHSV